MLAKQWNDPLAVKYGSIAKKQNNYTKVAESFNYSLFKV